MNVIRRYELLLLNRLLRMSAAIGSTSVLIRGDMQIILLSMCA